MGRRKSSQVKVVKPKNETDKYSIVLNDLARGQGIFKHWTALERILLICGLSCKDGWETDMGEIESWTEELGRDRQETLRRTLRERGHLTLRQGRVTEGPDAGMIRWTVTFYLEPLPVEQRDDLPAKKEKPQRKKPVPPQLKGPREDAANTMPSSSGHGIDPSVSAGGTTPWDAGSGTPGHGDPGPGGQGVAPYIEKEQERKTKTPPSSSEVMSRSELAEPHEGGEDSPKPQTPVMAEVVAWFVGKRPDWKADAIELALDAAVSQKLGDLTTCARALRELAEGLHGHVRSPWRLVANCDRPWFTKQASLPVTERRPSCRKLGHGEFPADDCKRCLVEDSSERSGRGGGEGNPEALERSSAVVDRWVRGGSKAAAILASKLGNLDPHDTARQEQEPAAA